MIIEGESGVETVDHLRDERASPQASAVDHPDDMTVGVTSDIGAAGEIYQELGADCILSAFQSRLWIECWQARLASPRGAQALFCHLRGRDGRILLLLPLCLRIEGRLRIIEGADLGVSDYLAPVMAARFRPTIAEWRALWPRIAAALPPHDVLRLTKIPLEVGDRPNPLAWIPGAYKLELQAHGVPVSAPWEECAKRVFSRNRREKLKKGLRSLSRLGAVRFRAIDDTEEMISRFEQLVAQRLRRFAALQRNDPLRDPHILDFYRAVIARGAASGFARITLMEVDDRPVAMKFGLCHAGAFHVLIPTFFEGSWEKQGPGMLLAARSMQWAAEAGLRYYDFTIGNEGYKGRLGATARDLVEVVSLGTWRGLPTVTAAHLKAWIKRQPLLLGAIRKTQAMLGRDSASESE